MPIICGHYVAQNFTHNLGKYIYFSMESTLSDNSGASLKKSNSADKIENIPKKYKPFYSP